MACGRRCAVAGPTVQRTGSRSFPIASASSLSRAVVVVRHAKRRSDTGIPPSDTGIPPKDALTPEFDTGIRRRTPSSLLGVIVRPESNRNRAGRARLLKPVTLGQPSVFGNCSTIKSRIPILRYPGRG